MANTFAPFGFQQIQGGSGGAPTFATTLRRIASTNTTPIYMGDPVAWTIGPANSYVTQAVQGGSGAVSPTLAGIFAGCKYISVSQKKTIWSPYWPGTDAASDVECWLIDDPNSRFRVQTSGASFYNAAWTGSVMGSLPIGQYAQLAVGTGNSATGQSGAYLSSVGTSSLLPFLIVDYIANPPGANGTDPTTNFPHVIVGFNNEILRSNGAGPTGIS